MSKYLLLISFLLFAAYSNAQSDFFGFGFRAGLSLAKIDGPSELGPNGEELEENKMASGFHIGMTFNLKFTDIMGMRGEAIYSQRGTDYTYEGPSYFQFRGNPLQSPVTITGTRRQTINVSNSYIDIPVTVYYKIGYFELFGGLNTGLLIGSTAGGEIEFEGLSPLGNNVPFQVGLDYNYLKDEAGSAGTTTQQVNVDGDIKDIPQFVGAYYEFPSKDKSLYKSLDFGITAGLSYFLNDGLYISGRYIHGLGDIDRNFYDRSLQEPDSNGNPVQRADINKSKSWQFSVGFTF